METLNHKLKINSKPSKNPFDYSLQRYSEVDILSQFKPNEVKKESNFNKLDYEQLASLARTFPSNKRDERKSSVELVLPVIEGNKKSSIMEHRLELPLDFSITISNSSKSRLLQKDEDSNGISSGRNDSIMLKLESKELLVEDARVFTFNTKCQNHRILDSLSKTSSFDFENNDHSILNPKLERKSLKPFINDILIQEYDMDEAQSNHISGLKTGDREEIFQVLQEAKKITSDLNYLSFDDTLILFHNSWKIYTDKEIWITSLREKLFCCKKKVLLSQEFQEHCEKLIIFSYVNFNASNNFHSSLLASVLHSLKSVSNGNSWEDAGFSCNPYENELKHAIANFGLFFVMFIVDYMGKFCENCFEYCRKHGLAFVSIAFDMAEITILLLREKKLNGIIMECQKCLEIVFFVAAGCLAKWFEIHQQKSKVGEIADSVKKQAYKYPKTLINLAKNAMNLA